LNPLKLQLGVSDPQRGGNMEEILICLALTVAIYAFMIVAYKKGW
jgi:hypothetical protein